MNYLVVPEEVAAFVGETLGVIFGVAEGEAVAVGDGAIVGSTIMVGVGVKLLVEGANWDLYIQARYPNAATITRTIIKTITFLFIFPILEALLYKINP